MSVLPFGGVPERAIIREMHSLLDAIIVLCLIGETWGPVADEYYMFTDVFIVVSLPMHISFPRSHVARVYIRPNISLSNIMRGAK